MSVFDQAHFDIPALTEVKEIILEQPVAVFVKASSLCKSR